jgi:hypothetical protein
MLPDRDAAKEMIQQPNARVLPFGSARPAPASGACRDWHTSVRLSSRRQAFRRLESSSVHAE